MPITSFDKSNLKNIRADIDSALKAVETKYGMKLSLGNIRFTQNDFKTSLTALVGEAASSAADNSREVKWRSDYLRNSYMFTGDAPKLDTELTMRGRKFIIVGMRPKANDPLVLKDVVRDKFIVASISEVEAALRK
jgi:hypothetical protein